MMPKKKKLNSRNPKYNKDLKETTYSKKVLIKEVKGVKIYFCYY